MQLNGIDLIGYNHHGTILETVLDTDFATANKLDGKELKVTEGDSDIQVFGGYRLTSLKVRPDGKTEAIFVIKVEPNISQAISSIQKDLDIRKRDIQNVQNSTNSTASTVADLSDTVEVYAAAIEELSTQVFSAGEVE